MLAAHIVLTKLRAAPHCRELCVSKAVGICEPPAAATGACATSVLRCAPNAAAAGDCCCDGGGSAASATSCETTGGKMPMGETLEVALKLLRSAAVRGGCGGAPWGGRYGGGPEKPLSAPPTGPGGCCCANTLCAACASGAASCAVDDVRAVGGARGKARLAQQAHAREATGYTPGWLAGRTGADSCEGSV